MAIAAPASVKSVMAGGRGQGHEGRDATGPGTGGDPGKGQGLNNPLLPRFAAAGEPPPTLCLSLWGNG